MFIFILGNNELDDFLLLYICTGPYLRELSRGGLFTVNSIKLLSTCDEVIAFSCLN